LEPPVRHSAAAREAAAALLAALQAEPASALRGAATRVQRGGKVYWYDSYRVGTDVRKAYLGEDSDELRAMLWRARADRRTADDGKPDRTRLVRLLKAEGLPGVDNGAGSLLAALASAGAFRAGLTVVGDVAWGLYEGLLGVRLALPPDLGRAPRLTLALPAGPPEPLLTALADFAFDPAPAIRRARSWRWRQTKGETLAGFLMDAAEADGRPRYVKPIGVYAQTPPGLDRLLEDSVEAAVPCRGGILVRVPLPARFAADRLERAAARPEGPDSPKARRDRAMAELLAAALSR
jgi:hypothetical protein